MTALEHTMAAALRRAALHLPPPRRDWVEAVLAEAPDVPTGWPRLRWLGGGAWLLARQTLTAKETNMLRRIGYGLAGLLGVAAVGLVFTSGIDFPYGAYVVGSVLVFAGLPWVGRGRGWFGPGAPDRAARAVRVGGYIVLSGLALAVVGVLRLKAKVPPIGTIDPGFSQRAEDIQLAVMAFLLFAGYTAVVLALTARRSWVRPRSLAAGGVAGMIGAGLLFGLVPMATQPILFGWRATAYQVALLAVGFGIPLVAAVIAAGSRASAGAARVSGLAQGTVAGLLTAGTGAAGYALITLADLVLFTRPVVPGQVPAAGSLPLVPVRDIGDAAGVVLFMVMTAAPLIGILAGALGGAAAVAVRSRSSKPAGQPA